jgi:hypothetical protein
MVSSITFLVVKVSKNDEHCHPISVPMCLGDVILWRYSCAILAGEQSRKIE